MEGSVAGGAPAAAAGEANADGTQGAAAPGADANAGVPAELISQVGEIASGLSEMREFMNGLQVDPAQQAATLEAQQQAEQDQYGFLTDDTLDPQATIKALGEVINQQVTQGIQSAVQPLQQQIEGERQVREAEQLASEFPELQDEKKANELIDASRQVAAHLGQPDLGANPQFMRVVLLAARAQESALREGGNAAPTGVLEGGGAPGGSRPGSGGLTAESIVGGAGNRGRAALPFG